MKKYLLFMFSTLIISCGSNKQASCPSFDIQTTSKSEKTKKRSKYRVVILKDGEVVGKTTKKRKRRKKAEHKLFPKKILK